MIMIGSTSAEVVQEIEGKFPIVLGVLNWLSSMVSTLWNLDF